MRVILVRALEPIRPYTLRAAPRPLPRSGPISEHRIVMTTNLTLSVPNRLRQDAPFDMIDSRSDFSQSQPLLDHVERGRFVAFASALSSPAPARGRTAALQQRARPA
jgi:hypothetical protein